MHTVHITFSQISMFCFENSVDPDDDLIMIHTVFQQQDESI